MSAILKRSRTSFFVAMIGLLCLSVMSPVITIASSNLVAGDQAIVTNDAMLRSDVGYTAPVIVDVGADTPASILDGPLTAADGSSWYFVQTLDVTGYLPASSLESANGADEVADSDAEPTEESTTLPWKDPVTYGVANDDVICRDTASTSGLEIVVVDNGQTVEITGEEVWAEDIGWTPVNCAGVGGFISSDYITIDEPADDVAGDSTGDIDAETDTDVVETEVATEPVEVETEVAEVGVTDETVESSAALPWSEPIGHAVTTTDLVCRAATGTGADEIVVLSPGETVEVTGEVVWAEGIGWTPVNCAGAGGFVSSEFLTTEDATNRAPAPETVETDVATEESTEAVATQIATDQTEVTVAEEVTPTEIVAQPIIEQQSASQDLQDASQKVVVEEPGAIEATEPVETQVATPTLTDETSDAVEIQVAAPTLTDETSEAVETQVATPAVTDETPEAVETEVATPEATETAIATDDASTTALLVEEAPSTSPVTDDQIIGTAAVQGTNGGGLACRTSPDASSSIITVMPEGLNVMVLGEPDANGWMSIVCGNQIGFAEVQYLWSGGLNANFDVALSSMATVNGTGGGGLNCRGSASVNASVIAWFPEGSAVNVRGDAQGNWAPVVCGGQNGFVYLDYLSAVPASGAGGDSSRIASGLSGGTQALTIALTNALATVISSPEFASGAEADAGSDTVNGSAVVSGTNGDGLRCRTGAGTSHSTITVVPEDTIVFLRGGAEGSWQPVVCGGQNGYMHNGFLSAGGNVNIPSTDPAPASSGLGNGDHAQVTSNLNLRYEPSTGGGVATYAPTGTVILITGPHAGNGYYPVNWDGLKGYMHGDYLVETNAGLSDRGGSGNPGASNVADGGGGSSTGNAIVDFAMGYVGYPYVWATHGPYSFDCSGFTYWVIKNVVGVDIGTGTWSQVSSGSPVSRGNLQPGDIVFFQNTYKAGLSHVGIYIGGGQFVHAENENTGVKVSDLNSSYYGSRWYGAVRIN